MLDLAYDVAHCRILQSDGERNFHVFYYLFAGLGDAERSALYLDDITSYHYIRGGVHGMTREAVIDIDMGHVRAVLVTCTLHTRERTLPLFLGMPTMQNVPHLVLRSQDQLLMRRALHFFSDVRNIWYLTSRGSEGKGSV